MEFLSSNIPGCYEIRPTVFRDHRGTFVKTYHRGVFEGHNLNTRWSEEYYSVSAKGVLRGLHFQLPPHDHEKLVYCTAGEVLDVVVDLRRGSPTYGRHAIFRLSNQDANMVYIARGLAHGFLVLGDAATMMYKVSSVYASAHDTGIRWDSAEIDWPIQEPVLSERDAEFPSLKEFDSPFTFEADQMT